MDGQYIPIDFEPPDIEPSRVVDVGPDQEIIYQINDDDSIGLTRKWKDHDMPEGFAKLPDNVEWVDDGSILFYDGGKFTKVKKTLEDANLEHEIEEKIKKKLRDNAIADLKASGDIPEDFDDSRLIKIKKEK
jgi:hypothetical protein